MSRPTFFQVNIAFALFSTGSYHRHFSRRSRSNRRNTSSPHGRHRHETVRPHHRSRTPPKRSQGNTRQRRTFDSRSRNAAKRSSTPERRSLSSRSSQSPFLRISKSLPLTEILQRKADRLNFRARSFRANDYHGDFKPYNTSYQYSAEAPRFRKSQKSYRSSYQCSRTDDNGNFVSQSHPQHKPDLNGMRNSCFVRYLDLCYVAVCLQIHLTSFETCLFHTVK